MLQPPLGQPWLLYGLLGGSIALNLVFLLDRSGGGSESTSAEVGAPMEEVALADAALPSAASEVAPAPAAVVAPPAGNWQVADTELTRSFAHSLNEAVGAEGNALAAVYARLFVWDLDLRRDLQKGDRIQVAWRKSESGDIEIGAARFTSLKLGRTLTAYRWHGANDAFTSYWQEDGTEVPYRLVGGPLHDYEQITSLLREGMDFKTPVGTPVYAPKAGVVTRTNWNWTGNGNCVEVQYTDGALAKFLHLSEDKVQPGQRVTAGEVLALTGNTGHSTAPHLHYQLEVGGKVVDPLDYHGSERRRLASAGMAEFQQEVARFDSLLDSIVAAR